MNFFKIQAPTIETIKTVLDKTCTKEFFDMSDEQMDRIAKCKNKIKKNKKYSLNFFGNKNNFQYLGVT